MSFIFPGKESRRKQLVPPPINHPKPSWEVTGQDKPEQPRWKVETDKAGKQTFRELIPPPLRTDGHFHESDRSRFTIELREACVVGSMAANAGDTVHCFRETAGCLSGRGRITREERNAF